MGVGNADGTLAMVFVNKVGDSIESVYELEVVVESRKINLSCDNLLKSYNR